MLNERYPTAAAATSSRANTWMCTPTQPPTLNPHPFSPSCSHTHTHRCRHTHIYSAKSPSLSADCEVIAASIEEKACGGARGGRGGGLRGKSISQYHPTAAFLRWTCIPRTGCVPLIPFQHDLKIYEHKGQLRKVQSAHHVLYLHCRRERSPSPILFFSVPPATSSHYFLPLS